MKDLEFHLIILKYNNMKQLYIILMIFIFVTINENKIEKNKEDIEVKIKLIENDNCFKNCYNVAITIKNNSEKDYYLTNIVGFSFFNVLDSNKINICEEFNNNEFNYYLKNQIYMESELKNIALSKKNDYIKFRDKAVMLEMKRLKDSNSEINDTTFIKRYFFNRYFYVLLLKKHEEFTYYQEINSLYLNSDIYYINFEYLKDLNKTNIEKETIYLECDNDTVGLTYDINPLSQIDNYIYFSKKLISDTLVLDTRNIKLKFKENGKPNDYDSILKQQQMLNEKIKNIPFTHK